MAHVIARIWQTSRVDSPEDIYMEGDYSEVHYDGGCLSLNGHDIASIDGGKLDEYGNPICLIDNELMYLKIDNVVYWNDEFYWANKEEAQDDNVRKE